MKKLTIGDIFCVSCEFGIKRYFQLIAVDATILYSDVIRVFSKHYFEDDTPQSSEIIDDTVEFYVHTYIKWGLKTKLWCHYAHDNSIGDILIPFRSCLDSNYKFHNISSVNWNIWTINGPLKFVGILPHKCYSYEYGTIYSAPLLVQRITEGKAFTTNFPSPLPDLFKYLPKYELNTLKYDTIDTTTVIIDSTIRGYNTLAYIRDCIMTPFLYSDWESLYQSLCDLSWLQSSIVRIVHLDLPIFEKKEQNLYLNLLHQSVAVWYNRNNWPDLFPSAKTIEVYFADQLKDSVKKELATPKQHILPIWEISNTTPQHIFDI